MDRRERIHPGMFFVMFGIVPGATLWAVGGTALRWWGSAQLLLGAIGGLAIYIQDRRRPRARSSLKAR